jgi:long-chain acyl-CoA synthetase
MTKFTNFIHANVAGTLDGLFRERVRLTPNDIAYRHFSRSAEEWRDLSWTQMADEVSRWQQALSRESLLEGDRVAILMRNCPTWVAFEQAALGLGLVVVPLYTDDRPDNIAYILNDSGSKLLLIEDEKQWESLAVHKDEMPGMQRFIIHHSKHAEPQPLDERVCLSDACLPASSALLHERGGDPHKLASIVYTSGTTGRPKGVMLSHQNILTTSQASIEALLENDTKHTMLSFLPLSHTFERTCGYYVAMMCNISVAYARSIQQLAEDLQTIKPTVLVSVPRIFERVYERIHQQLRKQSPLHRMLFNMAIAVGWQRFEASQGRRHRSPVLLLWPLLNRLVASKVQAKLGGRMQLAVSGGAALPATVARTFIGLGLNVIQGYGMTESSPVLTANRISDNEPTSVGKALPGVELRIGPNDELQARSPGVMLGYWNNHRATSETITSDGWLHTGDKARIKDEFVYITGRIKDILVMSNGEKIPPADMETAISLNPMFEQALLIGEGRPYLSALVVLNSEEWFPLARQHNLDPFVENSLNDRRLHHTLLKKIAEALHDFPGYAKVRRVAPLLEAWTVDNNLLTPTLKVKRAKVLACHADLIEQMYSD